jgi:hypothetical protein
VLEDPGEDLGGGALHCSVLRGWLRGD